MGSAYGVKHKYKIEWSLSQLSVEAYPGKKGFNPDSPLPSWLGHT